MQVELDKRTFVRLAQLYLVLLVAAVLGLSLESFFWADFIEAFDELTMRSFGTPTDAEMFGWGGLAFAGCIAHLAAAFGLLRLMSWSRSLIWMSFAPMLAFGFIPGFQVTWTGAWTYWIETALSMILGAILLLGYSPQGNIWFGKAIPPVDTDGKT